MAQVHSANRLGLPCDSGCISVAEQASAGSKTDSCSQSHPTALFWGVPASALQNLGVLWGKNTAKDHSLQDEWGYRFVSLQPLQSSGITPPWFSFSITPVIPSYHIPDHETCGTSSSSSPCPLSKHAFRNFSFRPSCFRVKTSLHYCYPQLISYFPRNHRSINLSSLS